VPKLADVTTLKNNRKNEPKMGTRAALQVIKATPRVEQKSQNFKKKDKLPE